MQNGELSSDEPCIGNMKSEEHDSELLPICELSGLVCECIDARYAPNLRFLTLPPHVCRCCYLDSQTQLAWSS